MEPAKYQVRKQCQWRTFIVAASLDESPAGPKFVAPADLKTADGKPLPADVVRVMVNSGNLVPCDADGEPLPGE